VVRRLVLGHAKLMVQAIHENHVDEHEGDEDVDAALLRKPKPQLESGAWNAELIELLYEEDAEPVGSDEPNGQQRQEKAEGSGPVVPMGIKSVRLTR